MQKHGKGKRQHTCVHFLLKHKAFFDSKVQILVHLKILVQIFVRFLLEGTERCSCSSKRSYMPVQDWTHGWSKSKNRLIHSQMPDERMMVIDIRRLKFWCIHIKKAQVNQESVWFSMHISNSLLQQDEPAGREAGEANSTSSHPTMYHRWCCWLIRTNNSYLRHYYQVWKYDWRQVSTNEQSQLAHIHTWKMKQ